MEDPSPRKVSRKPPPFAAPGVGRRRKAPEELIAHYTAKGMDERAAAEKVIDDLQQALTFSFERYPMQKIMTMERTVTTNVDAFNQRLSVLEAKVDSKPSLPAIFAAGVAAAGIVKGAWEGVPHVLRLFSQVSNNARNSTTRV